MNFNQLNRILEIFHDEIASYSEDDIFPNHHNEIEYIYKLNADRLSFIQDALQEKEDNNELDDFDADILAIINSIILEEKNK